MTKLSNVDCKYGAPMGRPQRDINNAGPVKLHLEHVPLNNGGYDAGGAYWGLRPVQGRILQTVYGPRDVRQRKRIYRYWWNGNRPDTAAGRPLIIEGFLDAWDREDAKAQVLEQYPEATFYR
jgi:hypothetical protein